MVVQIGRKRKNNSRGQRAERLSRFSLVVLAVAFVGVALVLISQAAPPTASLEAENGSLASPASKFTGSGLSGAGAVQFKGLTQLPALNIGSTLTSLGDPDPSGIVDEASGLIMSRKNNSGPIFWTHNDSGGTNQIFAISPGKGILATVTLSGATNNDWEDISFGPGPVANESYIYVGNMGSSSPNPREIYRIAEPAVNVNQSKTTVTIAAGNVDIFSYTSPVTDSEGLFIDPITGDGFIFQKIGGSSTRPRNSDVYRIPAAQFKAGGGTLTPEYVATIRTIQNSTNDGGITSADISADGSYFAICNYEEIFAWSVNRAAGQTVASVLAANAVAPYYHHFTSGWGSESIAFSPDRSRFYTLAEGAGSALKYVDLTYSP
jgi:hypothetical protein